VKLAEEILIDLGKSSDEVRGSEVVRWLARWHHSTLEEAIDDVSFFPAIGGQIKHKELHQALVNGFAELEKRGLVVRVAKEMAIYSPLDKIIDLIRNGLASDISQLSEDKKRRCAKRTALILGHILAMYPQLPRRGDLPKETEDVLGEALEPCVVDDYVTADEIVAPLFENFVSSMYEEAGRLYPKGTPAKAAKMLREVASIFSPLISAASIIGLETSKALVDSWRRRGFNVAEAFYALGLAALAAGAEVNEETADRLLYAASFAVQEVAHPAVVLPILAALRPLGEKAPNRYVSLLAATSELEVLDQETVQYIYDALQQLKDRLSKAEHLWPLVEAIRAYSNLLRKHSADLKNRWEEAVEDMWQLYSKIRGRSAVVAPEGGLSAQRLFDAIAKVYVLAVALENDVLAPLVQKYLGDFVREAEAVRSVLDEAVARPEELRKVVENDADFKEWVTILSSTSDAVRLIKKVRDWFMRVLNRYKPYPVVSETYKSDEKNRKKSQKRSKKRKMRTQR